VTSIPELITSIDVARQRRAARAKESDKYKRFYASWQWARVRYEFLKGKERKCACCGSTVADGERIVCDHIKPIRYFWDLRLDPKNLQLICDGCNRGKGSDETDWRLTSKTEMDGNDRS
jgi:5-methylcytosine-specific restriction endonuclease McrA